MRKLFILLLVLAVAFGLMAEVTSLSNIKEKGEMVQYIQSDYPIPRQGGDTIADAVVIPTIEGGVTVSGTTSGYTHDYDEACPYTGSTAPDVVYSFTPASDMINVVVSTCNIADYDTKLYIYENAETPGSPFACNDDTGGCAGYTSHIEGISFTGGNTYYIVVDGYGSDNGPYNLYLEGTIVSSEPDLGIAPSSPFDFGYAIAPITQSFTLSNIGSGTIGIEPGDITISGDAEFTISNIVGLPATLPSDIVTFDVTFTPVTGGDFSADVDVVWSGGARETTAFTIYGSYCIVDQPEGSSLENEPCGEDVNGGCNMPEELRYWTPIDLNETIYANTWANSGRDTDWYELILTVPTTVTWSFRSEIPLISGYLNGTYTPGSPECSLVTGINPYYLATPCEIGEIEMDLVAGTHWFFAAHNAYSGYPCPGANYWVSVTGAAITCPAPTDLAEANITASSADLSWTAGGTEGAWNLEYGIGGFEQGSGTMLTGLSTPTCALTGLTAGTWDWYVQADCGAREVSDWVSSSFVAFDALTNDVCEDAEVIGEVTDYPFDTTTATTSGAGTHSIGHDIWYEFDAPGDGTIDVDLCDSSFDTKLAVWDACGGTELAYNDDDTSLCPSGAYNSAVFDIPVISGEDYYIQVGGYANSVGAGDLTIVFTPAPECPEPTDLTEANMTHFSADLIWTAGGTEGAWDVQWGLAGFDPELSEGTLVTGIATTSYALGGLLELTGYDWYVRADCGARDVSVWAGPGAFTTLMTPGTCGSYEVWLYDSYGDGWNGGALDIVINGTPVLTGLTIGGGGGPIIHGFETDILDEITTVFSAGGWAYENSYYIYDQDGNEVGSDGLSGAPVGISTPIIACPPTGIISGIVREMDYRGDSIEGATVTAGNDVLGFYQTVTDAAGYYELEVNTTEERSVEYIVNAYADGFNPIEAQTVSAATDATTADVDFEMERHLDQPENLVAVASDGTVDLAWNAPPVPATVLWDQLDPLAATTGKSAQSFEASLNAYDAQVAADFILAEDATLCGAAFSFFYTGANGSSAEFNVSIYDDMNGYPGETPIATTNTTFDTPHNDVYEVSFLTAIPLSVGTYWIGYSMISDLDNNGQSYASIRGNLENGTAGYWRNPGDGFGTGSTRWANGFANSGFNSNSDQDLCFQIHGNVGTTGQLHISQTELITNSKPNHDDKPIHYSSTSQTRINLNAEKSFISSIPRPATGDYNIYRGTDPENLVFLATASDEFYTDNSVTNEMEYYYAVTATYTEGPFESSYSNIVYAHPQYARTIPYFEDFEADDGAYFAVGATQMWEWGELPAGERIPDEAPSGTKLWATNLDGNYVNYGNEWLVTVPFDLTGQSVVSLDFANWFDFENGWDRGKLYIDENNDGIFEYLTQYDGSSTDWQHESVIIPSAYYTDYVKLAFRFTSDSSVSGYDGWYIDDVELLDPLTPISFPEDETLEFDYTPFFENEIEIVVTPSANIGGTVAGGVVIYNSLIENWNGDSTVHLLISDVATRDVLYENDLDVTVTPVNDAPVIVLPDTFTFDEDDSIVIDFDAEGYLSDPEDNEMILTSSGGDNLLITIEGYVVTITNTPEHWFGAQEVTFYANDGEGRASSSDVVMVEVLSVNDVPLVVNPLDDIELAEDFGIYSLGDMGVVFFDPDSELEYSLVVSDPAKVTAAIVGNSVELTSIANEYTTTPVTLTITASEVSRNNGRISSQGITLSATTNTRSVAIDEIEITITPVNDIPEIVLPDGYDVEEEGSILVDFAPMVSDNDGDALTITANASAHLTITVDGMNVTIASEIVDWVGNELVTFNVNDGQGRAIASDDVLITVTNVNDVPTINLPAEFSFNEGTMLTRNLGQYINDVDGDDLLLTVTGNSNITVDISGLTVVFSTIDPTFFGSELLTFTVDDGQGERATASDDIEIVVNYINEAPVYVGPTYIGLPDLYEDFSDDTGVYNIGALTDLFTDQEISAAYDWTFFTFDIISFNAGKIDAYIEDGNLMITSVQNAFGLSTLRVRANDNDAYVAGSRAALSLTQNIDIYLEAVNDLPYFVDLPTRIDMAANSIQYVNFEAYVEDIDNPVPELTIESPDGFAVITLLEGYDYRFKFNALGLFDMQENIILTLNDGDGGIAVAEILIAIAASEPPYSTYLIPAQEFDEDFELTEIIDLDECFADPDDEFLNYEVSVLTFDGAVPVIEAQIDVDNVLLIGSGIANWFGDAEIRIDCWDREDRYTISQNVVIFVNSVNDLPVVIGSIADQFLMEDFAGFQVADLTTIFEDIDGDALTYDAAVSVDDVVTPLLLSELANLESINDMYGATVVTISARDNSVPYTYVTVDFAVEVTDIYDFPTFMGGLDGELYEFDIAGELLDLTQFVDVHNQSNTAPLSYVFIPLPGIPEPCYEITQNPYPLYGFTVTPVGYQPNNWHVTYPDQDCTLILDGGDEVTLTFTTNQSPYILQVLPDLVLNNSARDLINLDEYFADPQDYDLTYSVIYETDVLEINQEDSWILFGDVYQSKVTEVTVVASNEETRSTCAQTFQVVTMVGIDFSLLIVDQDHSGDYDYDDAWGSISSALEACGIDYGFYHYVGEDNGPSAEVMMAYDMVLWFTGESCEAYETLSDTDELNIAAFIDNGGWFYLNSQDYLSDKYVSRTDERAPLEDLILPEGDFGFAYLGLRLVIHDYWSNFETYGAYGTFIENFMAEIDDEDCRTERVRGGVYTDYIQEHVGNDLMLADLDLDRSLGANSIMFGNTTFSTVPLDNYTEGDLIDYFSYIFAYYNGMYVPVVRGGAEVEESEDAPLVTSLKSNYPNPFNPTTKIFFALHQQTHVELEIYNIKGQRVRSLVNAELGSGNHTVTWNGKNDSGEVCGSGIYFYKMKTETTNEIKKMMMLK